MPDSSSASWENVNGKPTLLLAAPLLGSIANSSWAQLSWTVPHCREAGGGEGGSRGGKRVGAEGGGDGATAVWPLASVGGHWLGLGFQAEPFAPSKMELIHEHSLLSDLHPLILFFRHTLSSCFSARKKKYMLTEKKKMKEINKKIKILPSKSNHCFKFFVYPFRYF